MDSSFEINASLTDIHKITDYIKPLYSIQTSAVIVSAYFHDSAPPPFELTAPKFNIPHFLFTNFDIQSNGWIIVKQPLWSKSSKYSHRLQGKIPKFLSHLYFPATEWIVWHDFNQFAEIDPRRLITLLNEFDIGVFSHSIRSCVYDEALVVRGLRDSEHNIDRTIKFLESVRYPKNNGLFELTSFYRRNHTRVNALFHELCQLLFCLTSRDQILFPFLVYKYGAIKLAVLPGTAQSHSGGGNLIFSQRHLPLTMTINSWA